MDFPRFVRYFAAVITGAGVSLTSAVASAQAYPSKPVEIVIASFTEKGPDGQFARAVADILEKEKLLAQPLEVKLHSGRFGAAGLNHVVSRRGDPHTVLTVVTVPFLGNAARTKGGRGLDDYTPLALFALTPQAIIVSAESKHATVKDLLEVARAADQNSMVCASTSIVTERLAFYLIQKETRVKFDCEWYEPGARANLITAFTNPNWVPDSVRSVLDGRNQFTIASASSAYDISKKAKLRVLATTGEKRLPQLPDTPTLAEMGINVQVGNGFGFAMPAGVPREAAAAMEAALEKAHKSAAWREFAHSKMLEDRWMGSAMFADYLAQRLAEMQELQKAVEREGSR